MVLRMTGARKPSLAMSDAEHVGYVHLLGQQRTGDFRGRFVLWVFAHFLLIDC